MSGIISFQRGILLGDFLENLGRLGWRADSLMEVIDTKKETLMENRDQFFRVFPNIQNIAFNGMELKGNEYEAPISDMIEKR